MILGHCTVSGHDLISDVHHFHALQHLHGFAKVTHAIPGFKWGKAAPKLYAMHVVDVVKYVHPFMYVGQLSRGNLVVSLDRHSSMQSVDPAELPQKRSLFHTALYFLSRLSEADSLIQFA